MQDPLTLDQVIAFFTYDLRVYIFMVATCLGMLTNFIKSVKIQRTPGHKPMTFKQYMQYNSWNTALSVIGSILGFAYLYEQGTATLLAYYGVGFLSDNVLNKATSVASAVLSVDATLGKAKEEEEEPEPEPELGQDPDLDTGTT
jgi:hypothetical protein